MTTDTISVGSCPTCRGPAQFIDPLLVEVQPEGSGIYLAPGAPPLYVREVKLPNVDEDLGDGWVLRDLFNHGLLAHPSKRWEARATSSSGPDLAEAFGETPSQAYLALRTAIEARP